MTLSYSWNYVCTIFRYNNFINRIHIVMCVRDHIFLQVGINIVFIIWFIDIVLEQEGGEDRINKDKSFH